MYMLNLLYHFNSLNNGLRCVLGSWLVTQGAISSAAQPAAKSNSGNPAGCRGPATSQRISSP